MPRASVRRSAIASSAPAVRVLDQLGDPGQVERRGVVELLLGQAELHGHGHELRLGAVVQVPLDAAQPGRRVVHDARPALLEGADPLGARRAGAGAEQCRISQRSAR